MQTCSCSDSEEAVWFSPIFNKTLVKYIHKHFLAHTQQIRQNLYWTFHMKCSDK